MEMKTADVKAQPIREARGPIQKPREPQVPALPDFVTKLPAWALGKALQAEQAMSVQHRRD